MYLFLSFSVFKDLTRIPCSRPRILELTELNRRARLGNISFVVDERKCIRVHTKEY